MIVRIMKWTTRAQQQLRWATVATMGLNEGGVLCPFCGALGNRLIQCGLRRCLLSYQVASSSIQPFGHNIPGQKTLFQPRMSVTITFLTYSSYTSLSIAVVTTAPVYLFIARQSRNTSKFNRLYFYISAISKPIHFWFSSKFSAVQGLQSQL